MSSENNYSEKQEFYLYDDFEKVDKIDMHLHVNTYDHALIEQAHNDNFKILTINVDYHAFPPVKEQLEISASLLKAFPDTFAFATTFYMDGWDEADWYKKTVEYIDKTIAMGACSVKIWKNIGMDFKDKSGKLVMIDDAKFDKIFSYIKSLNVPLIGHLGEPLDCWLPVDKMIVNYLKDYYTEHPEYHMYSHPELPSYEDQINARDNMLKKNKDIVFVGAHFASLEWSIDKIAQFLDKFPNTLVDSAARVGEIQYQTINNRNKVRDFFIKYQDKIMYATDTFQEPGMNENIFKRDIHEKWLSDWRFFATSDLMEVSNLDSPFTGLNLPKNVIDKIYKKNAERIFSKAWNL